MTIHIILLCIAFVLPLIGLITPKKRLPYIVTRKAIAIIPAHNEESCISNIVKDCKLNGFAQVWVIADSCTDRTVEIATNLNCRVIEVSCHGKNTALNIAVPVILKNESSVTGVFIFDADNRIEKDFLSRAISYLEFYPIVQYRVRNLNYNSWTSRMYCILFSFNFRIQQALSNLHLSNLICGTGWACNAWVLQKYPFSNRCNSDFEFGIKMPLKIQYINSINVYDEKPNSVVVSIHQRVRWTRGIYQVVFGQGYYRTYAWQKLWLFYSPVIGLIFTFLFFSNLFIVPLTVLQNLFLSIFIDALYFSLLLDSQDAKHISLLDCFTYILFSFTHYFIVLYSVLTFKNHFWYRTPHKGGVI
jgi:cellulose synthase/poly-beta-1,6-N-acetylglucosamine synthase-like glycosyltransferase